ncbi:hydroxyethylthiazole kinase [Haematococcus lacustris]
MACATPMQPESELATTASSALGLYKRVVKSRPLIQCITNFVSMDIMANVLLAAGASPAMAHSLDEVEDFVGISAALLINMGTLSSDWLASKKLAAKQACALGKPWVLDPVGCGATPIRTRACLDMLRCKPTVVRGNASEILALAGAAGTIKGVDSCESSHAALPLAQTLAQEHQCIVAVSGEVDYVTDGSRVLRISGGDALLTYVTAAGCALTALIAAFVCEAPSSPLMATAHAMAIFKAAADGAVASIKLSGAQPGPGSFRVALLDTLYHMQHYEAHDCINIADAA